MLWTLSAADTRQVEGRSLPAHVRIGLFASATRAAAFPGVGAVLDDPGDRIAESGPDILEPFAPSMVLRRVMEKAGDGLILGPAVVDPIDETPIRCPRYGALVPFRVCVACTSCA